VALAREWARIDRKKGDAMIGFLSLRGWIFGSILTLGLTGPILAQDLDCSNVQTQTDMNFCAKQDWQDADDALNDIYKAAISQMKLTDSVLDAEDAGAVEALKSAQRLWVKYRDAACTAEEYPFTGGSIQPMIYWSCQARLTWARVEDLGLLAYLGN
jgi:uncharacterized protein YecT (DUF1311 family)